MTESFHMITQTIIQQLNRIENLLIAIQPKPKKAWPKRRGKPWHTQESQKLLAAHAAGTSINDLAKNHERTRSGIMSRLLELGKPPSEIVDQDGDHHGKSE